MAEKQKSTNNQKGIRESIRKFIVSLKRQPQNIAMVALAIAFIYYSLNLTAVSNTTAMINTKNMGQCEFAAMLFSILAFVCFLRAFPKRKKPDVIMLALLGVMMAILVFADSIYLLRIDQALNRPVDPIKVTERTIYIVTAWNAVIGHIVLIGISAFLLITLPIYSKLLRKINTSIDVEGNGEMGEIDISGEED